MIAHVRCLQGAVWFVNAGPKSGRLVKLRNQWLIQCCAPWSSVVSDNAATDQIGRSPIGRTSQGRDVDQIKAIGRLAFGRGRALSFENAPPSWLHPTQLVPSSRSDGSWSCPACGAARISCRPGSASWLNARPCVAQSSPPAIFANAGQSADPVKGSKVQAESSRSRAPAEIPEYLRKPAQPPKRSEPARGAAN
jgi:hypothetical protein